ncbi:cytoplasmic dynein light chain, putative [Ricinus communis]|uniref:Cytoplasmic dynein light chain, putative n=1 Tax=Ricinus communis TaxID=3988 RepID=B9SV39_RICCO|nr:cytoplasmic dynein light chain, putative [Ricinus communis]
MRQFKAFSNKHEAVAQVKLLKMLEGKAIVQETDMPEVMQSQVMELAYQALDLHEVSDCQSIARYIKQLKLWAFYRKFNSCKNLTEVYCKLFFEILKTPRPQLNPKKTIYKAKLEFLLDSSIVIYCATSKLAEQKFDEAHGAAWHCVVGKEFGSCITHLCGSFIFFRVEMLEFLIFKDDTDFSESKEEAIGVVQKPKKFDQ